MILIAHRGNINGSMIEKENSPSYLEEAINLGYHVETDVRYINNEFWLGHDKPQYKISIDFLKNEYFWCHAKNLDALKKMIENDIHCFWHQSDDVTLTTRNIIWTYPGKKLLHNSICVLPELGHMGDLAACMGVCSDYIIRYKNA